MTNDRRAAADTGIDRDIFSFVGTQEGDGLAVDARAYFLRPQYLAAARVHGAEPAIERAIENEIGCGRQYPAHSIEIFLDAPDLAALHRVPRDELAPIAARADVALHFHAVIGCAGNVFHLMICKVHATVVDRGIEQPSTRAEGGGLPVLYPDIWRAYILHFLLHYRMLFGIDHRHAGGKIDLLCPVLVAEWFGHQHLPTHAVDGVAKTVTVEMNQNLTPSALPRNLDQYVFVYAVIVPFVVRCELVGPFRDAGIGVARKHCRTPQIQTGAL